MNKIIGLAWYRKEEWKRLLQLAADPEVLEKTYEEWQEMAQRHFQDLKMSGYAVRKVDVGVDELLAYCEEHKLPFDSAARSRFAAYKLREHHQSHQMN
jgi:hypothetical protein